MRDIAAYDISDEYIDHQYNDMAIVRAIRRSQEEEEKVQPMEIEQEKSSLQDDDSGSAQA